jgi:hypothetical protein
MLYRNFPARELLEKEFYVYAWLLAHVKSLKTHHAVIANRNLCKGYQACLLNSNSISIEAC